MVMSVADFRATGRLFVYSTSVVAWNASVGIKGDQQVYPLSSVNLLVYGVAIS
jgi:hypothetical protein